MQKIFIAVLFLILSSCSEEPQHISEEQAGLYVSEQILTVFVDALEEDPVSFSSCGLFKNYYNEDSDFSVFGMQIYKNGEIYSVQGPLEAESSRRKSGVFSANMQLIFEHPSEYYDNTFIVFSESEEGEQSMTVVGRDIATNKKRQVFDNFIKISEERYAEISDLLESTCAD